MTRELEAERIRKAAYRAAAAILEEALLPDSVFRVLEHEQHVLIEVFRIQQALAAAGAVPELQINQPEGDA